MERFVKRKNVESERRIIKKCINFRKFYSHIKNEAATVYTTVLENRCVKLVISFVIRNKPAQVCMKTRPCSFTMN